jgi:limonene-1,2-epoxide hydrolase
VLAVAAVGSGAAGATLAKASPEAVVRAWSKALNANRNADAAALFARNAHVVQPGLDVKLSTRKLAIAFNNALPCAGKIVQVDVKGRTVVATFVLGERPKHRCDGPGNKAAALFVVDEGKIVLWEQVPVPPQKPTA